MNLEEAEWNAIPAQDPSVSPEDRQLLQESLAKLGAEERRIVLLHAVTGLKHREIAQLLEQPLSTVRHVQLGALQVGSAVHVKQHRRRLGVQGGAGDHLFIPVHL